VQTAIAAGAYAASCSCVLTPTEDFFLPRPRKLAIDEPLKELDPKPRPLLFP
jgi:hypothetical protein